MLDFRSIGSFAGHGPGVWGENDLFFSKAGAEAFSKYLEHIEYHFFDNGHFMLEEHSSKVAELIHSFIQNQVNAVSANPMEIPS